MGQKALEHGFTNVCLLTGNLQFSNESDFYQGFMKAISASNCLVTHIQTDSFRKYQNIMQIFNGMMPQTFFISNYGFAESVKDICTTFYDIKEKLYIFTVSPVRYQPGNPCLGICKYSERPEDALSFIKWMCSEPISSAASLLGSTSPCRQTYDNYEIINNFPWLNLVKKSFVLAKGNRMPEDINLPFDERKFLNILGMAVKNAYNNICTPEEALTNAQRQFEQYFQIRF